MADRRRRLLRQIAATVRAIPTELIRGLWRAALRPHMPAEVGEGHPPLCTRCVTEWPWNEWVRLEREAERLGVEPWGGAR